MPYVAASSMRESLLGETRLARTRLGRRHLEPQHRAVQQAGVARPRRAGVHLGVVHVHRAEHRASCSAGAPARGAQPAIGEVRERARNGRCRCSGGGAPVTRVAVVAIEDDKEGEQRHLDRRPRSSGGKLVARRELVQWYASSIAWTVARSQRSRRGRAGRWCRPT